MFYDHKSEYNIICPDNFIFLLGKNKWQKWQAFVRNTYENKTGVNESFKKILLEFEAAEVICRFAISLCLHINQKWDRNVFIRELKKQR